jgi:hypothetical protein
MESGAFSRRGGLAEAGFAWGRLWAKAVTFKHCMVIEGQRDCQGRSRPVLCSSGCIEPKDQPSQHSLRRCKLAGVVDFFLRALLLSFFNGPDLILALLAGTHVAV